MEVATVTACCHCEKSWIHKVQPDVQNTKALESGDDEDEEENVPDFTCTLRTNKYHPHTHAPADHLIYHLGRNVLLGDNPLRKSLLQLAASHWKAVQCTRTVIKQHFPGLKIRIPGGKISKTVPKA